MESLLDVLVDKGVNERMDHKLFEDEEYLDLHKELEEAIGRFDELELDDTQQLVVDRMVSAYTAEGAFYGEKAYRQGIFDCVELLKEIHIL